MAFRDCIRGVTAAAGRELSNDEILAIYERVHKAALDIKAGRAEPDDLLLHQGKPTRLQDLRQTLQERGQLLSGDDIVRQSAERAARELIAEANKAEQQAFRQVTRIAALLGENVKIRAEGIAPLDAIEKLIARDYTDRVNVASLEQVEFGYQSYFLRKLMTTWDALGNDYLGFFQDRGKMIDLIREIRGEDTGNTLAKRGARAWLETAEEARQVFNRNGGDIGKLDDWGMPQHHSQERVAAVGRDAWVDETLPLLDRGRYTDEFTEIPWSDQEIRDFLARAWQTIATNGHNKTEPGAFRGVGKRANRHAEHRQIHFKNADAQIAYWERFGERSFIEILNNHIKTLSRDIAFIEYFGPNPDLTYRTLRDAALTEAIVTDPRQTQRLEAEAVRLDNLYDYAAGKRKPVYRPWLRKTADAIANANVFGKLGSAAITSFFGDKTMMEAVSHMNNLPVYRRWANEIAMLNPANGGERRLLQRQGLMLDSVRSGLQRFGDDLGQHGITGKIANATMRLTGMQAINDLRKGAFGLTLMDSIGHELSRGVSFAALADSDIRTLRNYGITETDWNTWKLARLDDMRGNHTLLTPEAISRIDDKALVAAGLAENPGAAEDVRRGAIVKLLGAINTESEFAIVTPGWRERALFHGSLQRGTVAGEIWKSVLQFKSFPWSFFQRSMDAVANQNTAGSKARSWKAGA